MQKFKDKDFSRRFKEMGDTSEGVFEQWADAYKVSYVSYGLSRPPFNYFAWLPANLRYTPDFLCEAQGGRFRHLRDADGKLTRHFMAEVKGVGRDQIVKIKLDNHASLKAWQEFSGRAVAFFVYDSVNKRVSIDLTVDLLAEHAPDLPINHFADRGKPKPYYEVPTEILEWEFVNELEVSA